MSEPIQETISPWVPMTEPIALAILGKLIEETSELGGRAARTIIQGIDAKDPKSGLSNRDELRREIADVRACINVLEENLNTRGYSMEKMDIRQQNKHKGFLRWHEMIREIVYG